MSGDDHLHHLAGTFGDAIAALLPPEFFNWEIGGEGDAAVNLHALVGRAEGHLVSVASCRRSNPRARPHRLSRRLAAL